MPLIVAGHAERGRASHRRFFKSHRREGEDPPGNGRGITQPWTLSLLRGKKEKSSSNGARKKRKKVRFS